MKNRITPYGSEGRWRPRTAIDYAGHPIFSRRARWRQELHRVIFGHLTRAGKLFDLLLILAILVSVAVVMIESVVTVRTEHGPALRAAEWGFTVLFTLEYLARLVSAQSAARYARSFFGVVDLLAILPTYISLLLPGGQALAVIRILRVVRVFRVLKLAQFIGGELLLIRALRSSAYKIAVFLVAVLTIVVVVGSVMYLIEGPTHGFRSIPIGVYWAIVTVTTVGFGDITPQTATGQIPAAVPMILGYAIIAVPTGIVTAEITVGKGRAPEEEPPTARACANCESLEDDPEASYCRRCGAALPVREA